MPKFKCHNCQEQDKIDWVHVKNDGSDREGITVKCFSCEHNLNDAEKKALKDNREKDEKDKKDK